MTSIPTSQRYRAYLERGHHEASCSGKCANCLCGPSEMWAISSSDVPIPRPGKWLFFPGSAANADRAFAALRALVSEPSNGGAFAIKLAFTDVSSPAIMVYTPDADDRIQLGAVETSVRSALVGAGFPSSLRLTYKPDEMTKAGIYSAHTVRSGVAPDGAIAAPIASTRHTGQGQVCRFFNTARGCSNGSRCTFLHPSSGSGSVARAAGFPGMDDGDA
jgi:hypothetical protein